MTSFSREKGFVWYSVPGDCPSLQESQGNYSEPLAVSHSRAEREGMHACMPACLHAYRCVCACLLVSLVRRTQPVGRGLPHSRWVCPPHLGNFHTGLPTGQPDLDTPLFLGYVSLTVVNLSIANRAAEATDCSPVLFSKSSRFCRDTMFSAMLLC